MNTLSKKKVISLFLVLALLMGTLAACTTATTEPATEEANAEATETAETPATPEPDEKVTLKIYAQYADEDTKVPYDYAVEQLAIEYPNVTLELDIQAQDDGQKLQSYAATGNLPDIFQVGTSQISTFKESNNIAVLDDYVVSTGFGDKLHESAKELLWNEDGHAYAFPYAGNELVLLYYNKAIFEEYNVEVPTTIAELETAIATFNENDIVPLSIFAKEKWITTALYDVFATRYDAEGIKKLDRGQDNTDSENYVKAAETLHELVEMGLLADGATNMNYDQAASLFYEGKAAMFLNGQWEIAAATEALGEDVDWMYYPVAEGYEENAFALSGGGAPGGYAVSPYTEYPELAAEVAAFVSEKYCEAKYLYRGNPLTAIAIDESLTPVEPFQPMMEKLSNELGNITSTTAFAWGLTEPKFKVLVEDQSQFLLTPGYSAEEFTTEMTKGITRIMGE